MYDFLMLNDLIQRRLGVDERDVTHVPPALPVSSASRVAAQTGVSTAQTGVSTRNRLLSGEAVKIVDDGIPTILSSYNGDEALSAMMRVCAPAAALRKCGWQCNAVS